MIINFVLKFIDSIIFPQNNIVLVLPFELYIFLIIILKINDQKKRIISNKEVHIITLDLGKKLLV